MRQPPRDRSHRQSRIRSDRLSFAASRRYHRLPGLPDGNRLQSPSQAALEAFAELTIVASNALPPDRAQGRGAIVRVRDFASLIAASWSGGEAGSRYAHAI